MGHSSSASQLCLRRTNPFRKDELLRVPIKSLDLGLVELVLPGSGVRGTRFSQQAVSRGQMTAESRQQPARKQHEQNILNDLPADEHFAAATAAIKAHGAQGDMLQI